jgi:hypothetical protein
MATLTLTQVWVNLMSTGESVVGNSTTSRSQSYAVDGDVRTYAGGRQRSITQLGERGRFEFTLELVSLTALATLRSWAGQAVQVRDHRGQQWYGTYFEVAVGEHRASAYYSAQITLLTVTVGG